MPKNDFISDNLVHMRDRLKENAAKAAVSGAVPPAVREPEPEKPRLSARQPMRSASGGDDDFLRQKREFEGYLERDRAAAAASLEVETRRLEELQRFAAALEELDRAFRQLGPAESAETRRELEKLRFAHYRAAGRASAFLREKSGGPLPGAAAAEKPFRRSVSESLQLAAAVVVSALIVASALFILFH